MDSVASSSYMVGAVAVVMVVTVAGLVLGSVALCVLSVKSGSKITY